MDNAQNQLIEKIHDANNILVTVSRDPSVDQLAACLGLTLLIIKLNKHGTAVFSGEVPSTIEFLQPEQTIEKNTDSLRDFIIALDKSKADKLRYKVEDEMVRIFITPYRTSISDKDLEFSQGDFNVDMVIALGVTRQEDLDDAITAHGRILHDATVTSINTTLEGALGTINWHEPAASSLSELVAHLARNFGQGLLDEQIATALLTGIVAETKRFSNEKTTAQTMSVSAELMAAGANQQLVATKLEEPAPAPAPEPSASDDFGIDDDFKDPSDQPMDVTDTPDEPPKPDDGTLEIEHTPEEFKPENISDDDNESAQPTAEQANDEVNDTDAGPTDGKQDVSDEPDEGAEAKDGAPVELEQKDEPEPQADSSDQKTEEEVVGQPEDQPPAGPAPDPNEEKDNQQAGNEVNEPKSPPKNISRKRKNPKLVTDPPKLGGRLTANTQPEPLEPSSDPMSLPAVEQTTPLLDRSSGPAVSTPEPPTAAPQALSVPDPILPGFTPPPPAWVPPVDGSLSFATDNPLSAVASQDAPAPEQQVQASELITTPTVGDARDEVMKALNSSTATPAPIQALNAQPLGDELRTTDPAPAVQASPSFVDTLQQAIPSAPSPSVFMPPIPSAFTPLSVPPPPSATNAPLVPTNSIQTPPAVIPPLPSSSLVAASQSSPQPSTPQVLDENAAPPVPPPIPFHFGNSAQPPQN